MTGSLAHPGEARAAGVVSAATGIVLLARPDLAAAPAWVVRLLGSRLAVQGAVEAAAPRPKILIAGAVVDLLHGASMIAAARIWPQYRRAATASAGFALASAGVRLVAARL